jgi:2,3-bisphosphoglycerate-dependent phosphoglycerate mutase
VLITAHGHWLRGIVLYLSGIGDQELVGLVIPTGRPIVYELGEVLSVNDRFDLT